MPKLSILIVEPGVQTVARADCTWILLGLDRSDRRRLEGFVGAADGLEGKLVQKTGDACIIRIRLEDKRPVKVCAWKGVTSSYEVFYSLRPDGEILICDHFRNILSQLPVSDRRPSEAAVVDHFLFRCVPGTNSYCGAVQRLGHGEKLSIDVASREVKTAAFDWIEDSSEPHSIEHYVAQVDRALASFLDPIRMQEEVANLFSGGVDSTLIQSYLGSQVQPINVVPEPRDFYSNIDAKYRTESAKRLGLTVDVHSMEEAKYVNRLEETIQAIGMPPHHMVMVLYGEAFKLNFRTYIVGEKADALFGWGGRVARVSRLFASPLGILCLNLATALLPPSKKFRWHRLRPAARCLSLDPEDPFGYGLQVATFTNFPLVEAIFSPQAVRNRLNARLGYTVKRIALSAPKRNKFIRHIETAQFIDYFCDDTFMIYRQIANANGKSVYSPFLARSIVSSALEVPVTRRYFRGRQGKYLLKQLLTKRLPGYPVNQRKGYTVLPLANYFTAGPLCNIWEHYRVPEFIEGEMRQQIQENPNQVTWNALSYAIWEAKVVRNPDLRPISSSLSFAWDIYLSQGAAG